MSSEVVRRLASYMKMRLAQGQPPYNFFLGAGASVPSAYPTGKELVEQFLKETTDVAVSSLSDKEKRSRFDKEWHLAGEANTSAFLKSALPPINASRGYNMLASLARLGYVSTILTTNIDTLLDQAFQSFQADLRSYTILSHPLYPPKHIADTLSSAVPYVKVVKLHGDLRSGRFLFTNEELRALPHELTQAIRGVLYGDTVFCGYSFTDPDVTACLTGRPDGIMAPSAFIATPDELSGEAEKVLEQYSDRVQKITGSLGDFDSFMAALTEAIYGVSLASLVTFDSRINQRNLIGINVLKGDYWTSGDSLEIGSTDGDAVIQIGQVYLGEGVIDIRGSFVDSRSPDDWFGISPATAWSFGYLLYLRVNGRVELYRPIAGDSIVASSQPPQGFSGLFQLRVTKDKSSVKAQLLDNDNNALNEMVYTFPDGYKWEGPLYMHCYNCRIALSSITVRPL